MAICQYFSVPGGTLIPHPGDTEIQDEASEPRRYTLELRAADDAFRLRCGAEADVTVAQNKGAGSFQIRSGWW